MGYVYVFEFPNGKRYVGQTMDPQKRFFKCHYKGKVREAINFFGWDNVNRHTWEVPDSQMDDLERFLISVYKSDDIEFGYNSQTGGKKGFKQSEELCNKMSIFLTGRHQSEQTIRKRSESLKGKQTFLGHSHTAETRRKQSEAAKRLWANRKQASQN